MSTTLEVRGLAVPFGDGRAGAVHGLRDITFSVSGGDCLAVLGVSGSGKSSLLRALAGLQRCDAGVIRVNDRDVTALRPEQRSVVYLHQEPVLFPHRTVVGNVAFPLQVRGVGTRDAARRAMEWLARLQVDALAMRMPDQLSGGQRHRVALARALCAEPAVLLLDEPLASLDSAVRRDVGDALHAARQASGAAMVLVTHDLDDALAIATRILTLGAGTQTALDAPDALLAAPPSLAVARLLGIYAEVPGEVVQGAGSALFRWAGGVVPLAGALAGGGAPPGHGPAVACVRAHEVQVSPCSDAAAGVGMSELPSLTVTDRRDGARDAWITLRDAAGATVSVRTGSGTVARTGDIVQVTLHRARLFPPD